MTRVLLEIQAKDCAFTSLDLNPLENFELCTLDSDNFLKLWDLNAKYVFLKFLSDFTIDYCHNFVLFKEIFLLFFSSCLASVQIPTASDLPSWGYLKFSNKSNNIFVANTQTIFVKDQRVCYIIKHWILCNRKNFTVIFLSVPQMPLTKTALEFSPSPIVDDCERISFMMNSLSSPIVYVGTSHHLLSLDIRLGWNQRWTHLLQAPPMYGSVFCDPQ